MDKSLVSIQKKRALIMAAMREFFASKGFLEVFTPSFVKLPGMEPYLNPLSFSFADEKGKWFKGFVITSPEYALKKLLSREFPKLYEITKVFRQGESFGPLHNPEFTLVEWYRPHSDYKKIMQDTEQLVCAACLAVNKTLKIKYGAQHIDLSGPWRRISVKSAFQEWAHIDLDRCKTLTGFKKQIGARAYPIPKNANWDDLFYLVFLNEIEPRFPKDKPIMVYDYPLPQAALAKRTKPGSFYAQRFEAYIGGIEIANAFSELTNWREQYTRLQSECALRKKLGKEMYGVDMDFINALRSGMPETGGIALGIERLQMILLNIQDINNLLPFPAKDLWRA